LAANFLAVMDISARELNENFEKVTS